MLARAVLACCLLLLLPAEGQSAVPQLPLSVRVPVHLVSVTVVVSGQGAGAVSDGSGAIDCPSQCQATLFTILIPGSVIELTASPAPGSRLAAWGGACAGDATTCSIDPTALASASVTADFEPVVAGPPQPVNVTVGPGGSVASSPAAIDCPATACSASIGSGVPLVLRAAPSYGYDFAAWTGPCLLSLVDPTTCTLTVPTGGATVGAVFVPDYAITVVRNGDGTVSSNPPGFDAGAQQLGSPCGQADPFQAICRSAYAPGTRVTLTEHPPSGGSFAGWSVATCQLSPTCVVKVDRYRYVTASFSPLTLTVHTTGSGTITSKPSGIVCGNTCSWRYPKGTVVTLTAVPVTGVSFTGWFGCTAVPGNPTSCTVAADVPTWVSAGFSDSVLRIAFEEASGVPLTVTKAGAGVGTVKTADKKLDCEDACRSATAAQYRSGDHATLREHAEAGSVFAGWSWQCLGQIHHTTCTVPVGPVSEVQATFRRHS